MKTGIVISSRVRLARNYADLPFDTAHQPEKAAACVSRTENALKLAKMRSQFDLLRLNEMTESSCQVLAEKRLISRDLLANRDTGAVLLSNDGMVSVMMNEEDHLRIQATQPGLDLPRAAHECFVVDDAISRHAVLAFDEQLGYLTACPSNTGTGMRASLLMHLPMLTKAKQMGNVGQLVSKLGLNIRGVYGEGSEALGHVYQISNQVTLGRTEQELINTVTAVGVQLRDMEAALRGKAYKDGRAALEDMAFRALGILTHARVMPLNEFYTHWSYLRIGVSMGMIELPLEMVDAMIDQAHDANVRQYAGEEVADAQLSECRASWIRDMFAYGDRA